MTEPAYPERAPLEPASAESTPVAEDGSGATQANQPARIERRAKKRDDESGGIRGSRSRSRSHSRSAGGAPAPMWKRPWLRAKSFWKYWNPSRIFAGGLGSGVAFVDAMLRFDGTDYKLKRDDGRVLVRTWPSNKTLWNPLWWISSSLLFTVRWLVTRRYLPLLLATPAAVAVLGLIGAISAGNAISPGAQSIFYKRMLASGISDTELPRAKLAIDALIRSDPSNTDAVFDRALLESKAGNIDLARGIMEALATGAKSPNAALWRAQSIGDTTQFASWSKQQLIDYHKWVQVAVENSPNNPLPRRMLGDVRALVGNKKGAYEALLPIADIDTDTAYVVYFLQKDLGHTELALARGEKLDRVYRLRLQDDPKDTTARIQYGMLLASLQRIDEAKGEIKQGQDYATTAAEAMRLNKALSDLLVYESVQLAQNDNTPRGLIERMSKLKQAADADPTNPDVLEAITQVCFEAAKSEDDQLTVLRESLVQNIDPDTSHFILGTIALNEGKVEEAAQHLELAAKNNPNMPGFLNNLAHAISHSETPDLERALRIANAANALVPNHPYLRETRGQIYVQLQRYTDAIADLEFALNAPELRPQVREGLAQAYQALGQTEIAKRQRELASQGK